MAPFSKLEIVLKVKLMKHLISTVVLKRINLFLLMITISTKTKTLMKENLEKMIHNLLMKMKILLTNKKRCKG